MTASSGGYYQWLRKNRRQNQAADPGRQGQPLARRWARPWASTASTSWSSARPSTPRRRTRRARSSRWSSPSTPTAPSPSSPRPRRPRCCCSRPPAREGLRRAQQEQGGQGHHGPGRGDRQAEDARSERQHLEAAMSTIVGTARSMGLEVVELDEDSGHAEARKETTASAR